MSASNNSNYDGYSAAILLDLKGRSDPASARLRDRYNKKLNPYANSQADDAAIQRFREDIERVRNTNLSLSDDDINNMRLFITHIFENGTRRISDKYSIESYPQAVFLPETLSHPDFLSFGHGANANSSLSSIVDKLNSGEISITNTGKAFLPFLNAYHPALYDRVRQCIVSDDDTCVVEGSRITTVPKNSEISRVIACEPTINLWFELAVGYYFEECLRSINLDIRHQSNRNQALAKQGSEYSNQASNMCPCTIDLSSASDSITIDLVKAIFPKDIFNILMGLRSPKAKLPKSEEYIDLPMLSTMGNGFTFPLLTMICLAIVYACGCKHNLFRGLAIDFNLIGVFGDDIIVPRLMYNDTITLLQQAGFVINHNKSYSEDLFRESCGGDYQNGLFITPVYVKSLETRDDILVAVNQCLDWSSRHIYLENTLNFLLNLLDKKDINVVPISFSEDSGIQYPTTEKRHSVIYIHHETINVKLRVVFMSILTFFYLSHSVTSRWKTTSNGIYHIVDDTFYSKRGCKRKSVRRKIYWPFPWNILPIDDDMIFRPRKGLSDSTESLDSMRVRHARRCNQIDLLLGDGELLSSSPAAALHDVLGG